MTERIALIVEYSGTGFHGWQRQAGNIGTVQTHVESAVSQVANHPVQVTCAGRTDAGVHATKQVVHFDTVSSRLPRAWILGSNAHLPDGIAVVWSGVVAAGFSARFSARWRHYKYLIFNSPLKTALFASHLTRVPRPLCAERMNEAAQALLGERDFSSMRGAGCQSRTPMRCVHTCSVVRDGDLVVLDIVANAFLLHMVRNIAGVLMDIGAGVKPVTWMAELLSLRDRTAGSVTAPAAGLYLVDVGYPDEGAIPAGARLPHLFARLGKVDG